MADVVHLCFLINHNHNKKKLKSLNRKKKVTKILQIKIEFAPTA